MEIIIPENRGAKTKYDFSNMKIGDSLKIYETTTGTLLNCAKRYAKINKLGWKFRCYTDYKTNKVVIVRVK